MGSLVYKPRPTPCRSQLSCLFCVPIKYCQHHFFLPEILTWTVLLLELVWVSSQAGSSTTSATIAVGVVASILASTIVEAYFDPVFMENNGVREEKLLKTIFYHHPFH